MSEPEKAIQTGRKSTSKRVKNRSSGIGKVIKFCIIYFFTSPPL